MTNLVEILRNAPRGLELYSPIYGEVTLLDVQPRSIYVKCESIHLSQKEPVFDEYGRKTEKGECLLFPSSEHRNWDGWQYTLFKPGHFITAMGCTFYIKSKLNCDFNAIYKNGNTGKLNSITAFSFTSTGKIEQFYAELARYGYTLVNGKLEKRKENKADALLGEFLEGITKLIDSKPFTVDDFKPFDKVLVKDSKGRWHIQFFSHYNAGNCISYTCLLGCEYKYCVPYNEETKHLLNTNYEYNGKYKNW